MKQITVTLNVDESAITAESGLDNLDEAIRQELGWLHDSGMFVENWSYVDPEKEKAQTNYTQFSTEDLVKMEQIAYTDYYRLATMPLTNPSPKDLEPLNKATAKLEIIRDELRHRKLSLNEQIQSASTRAAESHSIDKAPAKETSPDR